MKTIRGVLFDLDGTLLDTAPDLLQAFNQLRAEENLSPIALPAFRPLISLGSKSMVKSLLGIDEQHARFEPLRKRFFELYDNQIAGLTCFYPQMENVLHFLETNHIPWGIVTNKLTSHTKKLLASLGIANRPHCVICGDTLAQHKPHPEPIRQACRLLGVSPHETLYVGDSIIDVMASKAAGTQTVVALYGYNGEQEDPYTWAADAYIQAPEALIELIK